ncbi:MAG: DUF1214 domain-containing protein [Hyphomonas sp.]
MKIVSGLVGLLLGALLGVGTALAAAGMVGQGISLGGKVDAGGWHSDWTIGSASANPWTRARIARHGLLALNKDEAVYFTKAVDDAGDRLTQSCTYKVSGGAMPAQWWSITLYNASSYLPDNSDNALSFDLTDAAGAGDTGAWSFTVSPEEAQGGWVSSNNAGNFDLTLRLYKPDADLLADPEATLAPPSIEKLSCGEVT